MKIKRIFSGILAAGMLAGYALFPNGAELFTVKASAEEGDVAINETNFPDEFFRDIVKNCCDQNSDNVLSADEIAAVKDLELEGYAEKGRIITSMKGVELFKNLSWLSFAENEVSEIDLSKNTELATLWCWVNKLTSLDISRNTRLDAINCNDNPLKKLDISKNTKLRKLFCGSCELTELDTSNNTMLEEIYCWSNSITKVDLSNNTKLTSIALTENQLTSLDTSNNPALEFIICDDNKITTLDLSNNKELKYLSCQNNNITVLDLRNNDKLETLETDKDITIYGIAGSYAEEYAKENGIKFIDVNAPAPTVTGTITVSGKDDTAEGVSVTVTDANGKPCSVDIDLESGELSISGLSDGTYTLTITKSKYCPRDCTVTIAGGQMTGELDVKLQKYGDIDNTGEINISDALQIVNYRNSKTSSFDKASGDDLKYLEKLADINNDGQVNINDALQIVNFRNGKASSFDKIA